VNTYAVMKSGFKKVDSTGKSTHIPSRRAEKRLVCIFALLCNSLSLLAAISSLNVSSFILHFCMI